MLGDAEVLAPEVEQEGPQENIEVEQRQTNAKQVVTDDSDASDTLESGEEEGTQING